MIEKKFRVYDKREKKFIGIGFHVVGEFTMFNVIDSYCFYNRGFKETTLERMNDIEVTQWIGLLDANKVDIYEKDIIKYYNPNSGYGNLNQPEYLFIEVPDFTLLFEDSEWDGYVFNVKQGIVAGNLYNDQYLLKQ
jgi:hypothetical protein